MDKMVIPSITVICYLMGEFFKIFILKEKEKYKYIPVIVGFIGGILGIIMNLVSPFASIFNSIMIGIISGLASTGADQVIKQILKGEGNGKDTWNSEK